MGLIQSIFAYEYLGRQHLTGFDKYKVCFQIETSSFKKSSLIFFSLFSIAALTIRLFQNILCTHFGMRS